MPSGICDHQTALGSFSGNLATIESYSIPEPSTILGLLTIGGIGLGASKRKQG